MPTPTDYLKKGALRAIEPAISFLARNNVSPNALTTVGTLLTVAAAGVYATGHIMTAGWVMSAAAFFDVVGGEVAGKKGGPAGFRAVFRLNPEPPAPHFEPAPIRHRPSFPPPPRSDAPAENRGNADLTASAILITTEKAIGQIVLW